MFYSAHKANSSAVRAAATVAMRCFASPCVKAGLAIAVKLIWHRFCYLVHMINPSITSVRRRNHDATASQSARVRRQIRLLVNAIAMEEDAVKRRALEEQLLMLRLGGSSLI